LINAKGQSKLADFGVAGQLSDTIAKRNTVVGTPFWMAPEVIQEVGYGVQADIWSFGITMIELAEERPPYHEMHPMRAMFMIPSKPPPKLANEEKFSSAFVDFIARCLIKDPTQRPSAVDLLADPFIVGVMGDISGVAAEAIRLNQAKLDKSGDDEERDSDQEEEEFFASLGSGGDQTIQDVAPHDALGREPTVIDRGRTIRHWGTRRAPSIPSPSFDPNPQGNSGAPISGRVDTVLDSPSQGRRRPSGPKTNESQPISSSKLPLSAYDMLKMVIDNGNHDDLSALLDMIDINLACELTNCKDRFDQLRAPLLAAIRERGR
jgi:serine/threonine protein kinase